MANKRSHFWLPGGTLIRKGRGCSSSRLGNFGLAGFSGKNAIMLSREGLV